jgi:hypothetical protein
VKEFVAASDFPSRPYRGPAIARRSHHFDHRRR